MFKKIFKNPVKSIIGGGIGSALLGPVGMGIGAIVGGSGGLDSAGDFLKGKKKKYSADELADDINAAGKAGIDGMRAGGASLDQIYQDDPTNRINNQIGMENKFLRGSSEDTLRNMRSTIAQRGLQNSSVGLVAENNANRVLSDKLAMNNASGLERIRDANINNAQGRMNVGANLFGVKTQQGPIQMQTIKKREGGLAGMIGMVGGAAAGGMMGGPQGAAAGAQIGGGLGNYYQNS